MLCFHSYHKVFPCYVSIITTQCFHSYHTVFPCYVSIVTTKCFHVVFLYLLHSVSTLCFFNCHTVFPCCVSSRSKRLVGGIGAPVDNPEDDEYRNLLTRATSFTNTLYKVSFYTHKYTIYFKHSTPCIRVNIKYSHFFH